MIFINKTEITPYIFSLIEMSAIESGVLNREVEETVLLQEHEGIFSAGKSFEKQDFIKYYEFPIYYTKRGGRVTVHNPGQVTVYPIINLKKRNLNISEYVEILENWMIRVLKIFDISATISDNGIGVWINNSKIGFIGIRIEKGITTHGLCLNVNNDLTPFEAIIPCGIKSISITSMKNILKYNIAIAEVKKAFEKTCPF